MAATTDPLSSEVEPLIPRSDKAQAADDCLDQVRKFLLSDHHPAKLDDGGFEALVHFAMHFFLREGDLWRRECSGRHQKVIPTHRQFALIRAAHDELRPKGVYSIHIHLLVRFWWPMLEHNVKWYMHSCHECQVRRMDKVHIPPVIALPQPLFYKAYVDTFVMLKSGGYCYSRTPHNPYILGDTLEYELSEVMGLGGYLYYIIIGGLLLYLEHPEVPMSFHSKNTTMYCRKCL